MLLTRRGLTQCALCAIMGFAAEALVVEKGKPLASPA